MNAIETKYPNTSPIHPGGHASFNPGEITDRNRPALVAWLDDRYRFHLWQASVIVVYLALLVVLGQRAEPGTYSGALELTALSLLFLSILAHMACIWSIPKLKFAILTRHLSNPHLMHLDLRLVSWLGMFLFLLGIFTSAYAVIGVNMAS